MTAPRIKLSPIKRSLPEAILPVLNAPAPTAPATAVSPTPWRGVPVPAKRGSTAPFDPPQPFVAPEAYQPPSLAQTTEPSAVAAPDVSTADTVPAPDSPRVPAVPMAGESPAAPIAPSPVIAPQAAEPATSGSFAAAALSLSRAKGIGTVVPAGLPASAAVTPTPAVEGSVDGSGALLTESSQPAQIRAAGVFLKWTLFGLIGLAVAFALIRFVIPFVHELRNPGGREAIADKDAPSAVRMIQQTREVVAKNDANAAYLNEIAAAAEDKPVASKPAPVPAPVSPAAVVAPATAAVPAANDLARYNDAIERMKVDSVVSGAAARAMIDGRLVRLGDIVDRRLGLRFTAVDVEAHTVLFTNADNVVFKKYY